MSAAEAQQAAALATWLQSRRRVAVITGAGVSTQSGIPDYRDDLGQWKGASPMLHAEFVGSAKKRQRYWGRSFIGWQHFSAARPNATHHALARLQAAGLIGPIITQNVDHLHQQAGSDDVIDLHGRLDRVACLDCGHVMARSTYQRLLERLNPDWRARVLRLTPDGDAELHDADYASFQVAPCSRCGGTMKPEVVFYGGTLDPQVRIAARQIIKNAGALLVVGSSLMVASAYTLVRQAAKQGLAIAALNRGHTRADGYFQEKWTGESGTVLQAALARLTQETAP